MACDADIDVTIPDKRRYVRRREKDSACPSDPTDPTGKTYHLYVQSNRVVHNETNVKSVMSPKLYIRACGVQHPQC